DAAIEDFPGALLHQLLQVALRLEDVEFGGADEIMPLSQSRRTLGDAVGTGGDQAIDAASDSRGIARAADREGRLIAFDDGFVDRGPTKPTHTLLELSHKLLSINPHNSMRLDCRLPLGA